jgi:hypothetical protein
VAPENYDHGPLPATRIPAAEFEREHDIGLLIKQGKVANVDENCTIGQLRALPASVRYIRYPNGDVQRL